MSLKSVLTELSSAIQTRANCPGPLTLQDMTDTVKNIKGDSSVKFYRCEEYSPAATVIHIEQGLITLDSGMKISLVGEYIYNNAAWICNATIPQDGYQSAATMISIFSMTNATNIHSFLGISEQSDKYQPFAQTQNLPVYLADSFFYACGNGSIDQAIVLTGNTGSFSDCYSGFEISKAGNIWQQSTVLTQGLPAGAYTPEPGRIYSENTDIAVNCFYPEVPQELLKFYECASYTPEFAGGLQYSFTLSEASEAKVNGTYIRRKWIDTVDESIEDYQITAKWINENGCSLIEEYYYGEYNYSIYDEHNSQLYSQDGPNFSRVNNYNQLTWVEINEWTSIELFFSEITVQELPPNVESWSGYEMIKYNQEYTFTVSGAEQEECNGIYTVFKFSSTPHSIIYSNGKYFLCLHVGYDSHHARWSICDNPTYGASDITHFYSSDNFENSAPLTPLQAVWHGITLSPPANGWIKSTVLKNNMKAAFQKPKVGEIYSEDTSIRVRKMFDGAVYPITSDGLVFYAPLQSDYVDMISGKAATVTGGTFTEHNGLRCLELDGSEYINWEDNSDLPCGNSACSLVLLAAPINQYDWQAYMSVGQKGEGQIDIAAKNGHFKEWGGNYIKGNSVWQSLIVTRNDSGDAQAYLDGKLNGTGTVSTYLPDPGRVCVGANIHEGFIQKINSYVAFAAVYDRELSADEVREIHNILMDM